MEVFISHSSQDRSELENIRDALTQQGIQHRLLANSRPGGSLRDQLREAMAQCQVCIFIATRNSVDSSWCNAELGAFWGAGKPVIIYLASSSLDVSKLPKQFQGDVYEQRIFKVVEAAKALLTGGESTRPDKLNLKTQWRLNDREYNETLILEVSRDGAIHGQRGIQGPASNREYIVAGRGEVDWIRLAYSDRSGGGGVIILNKITTDPGRYHGGVTYIDCGSSDNRSYLRTICNVWFDDDRESDHAESMQKDLLSEPWVR